MRISLVNIIGELEIKLTSILICNCYPSFLHHRQDLNIFSTFTAKLIPDLEEESIKFNAVFPGMYISVTFFYKRILNSIFRRCQT